MPVTCADWVANEEGSSQVNCGLLAVGMCRSGLAQKHERQGEANMGCGIRARVVRRCWQMSIVEDGGSAKDGEQDESGAS